MKKADSFSYPCKFTGTYPSSWAGYTFLQATTQNALHPGIDWNFGAGEADFGMAVQAIANGVCVHTSEQAGIGYGEIVVLKHELADQMYEFIKSRYQIDSRTLYSFYAHLKDANVRLNQEVERGDLIGWIGKSGTEISHVHQELYKPVPGTQWRYWPTLAGGWDANRLKQYYLDTYDVIANQPTIASPVTSSDLQVELDNVRAERDRNWNWFIRVCEALRVGIDVEAAENLARSLVDNDQSLAEKTKQLTEAQAKVAELDSDLKMLQKVHETMRVENAKLAQETHEQAETIQKQGEKINSLQEALKDVKDTIQNPVVGLKKVWQGILELIGRRR